MRFVGDGEGAVVDGGEVEVFQDFVDVVFLGCCFVRCNDLFVGFESVFVLLSC